MKRTLLARCAMILPLAAAPAFGQTNIRSIVDGDWSLPATWTAGLVPAGTNNTTGDDAIVVAGTTVDVTAAQTARRLLIGEDGVPGGVVGTVNMTGGTLTLDGIYIGTDLDGSGLGSTPGNGTFNFIDGTITLNENINAGDPFSQAVELGTMTDSEGYMIMGDGTTSPLLSIAGGRVEVGGEGDTGAGNTTGIFDFRSGTIAGGNQNLIIGQSNTGGTALMTIGDTVAAGWTTPATYTGINSLNFNNGAGDLIIGNGGSMTANILLWQANNNAASTSNLTIQTGGTLTVGGKVDNRNGANLLTMDGGTFSFTNGGDLGSDAREVENLVVTANGGTFRFALDNGVTNGIRPFDVGNDLGNNSGDADPLSAFIDGTLTIDLEVALEANNSALLDTWIGGSAAWDPATPVGGDWDQAAPPDGVGEITPGTSWEVLVYDYDYVLGAPRGGFDNLTQGNLDGEFEGAGSVVLDASDIADFSLSVIDADLDQVGGTVAGVEGYVVTANSTLPVSPVTAVFDNGADAVTSPGDLDIGPYSGTDAAGLDLTDLASFAVTGDFNLGGTQQGTVNQGVLNVAPVGALAVSVGGDLVFGNGGPQGGVYNLNAGTLDVTGDIIEGDQGALDDTVNNAQLQIDTGAVGSQALTVGGSVTVQRFSVAQANGSVAGLEISSAAGLASVTSTGTTAIGTGTNASKDDPDVITGANGTVVVGNGGTLNALNINIAENGDSQGSLTIQGGGIVNSAGRIYVAGGQNTDQDNQTVGSITMEPGSSLTVQSGNLEIGRDGAGTFTFNGGTYDQLVSNLVLGQNGGAADSSGTVTISSGTFTVGNNADPFTSAININGGGGTITQTGGDVTVEQNLNMSSSANASSYTVSSGTLFVGQDYSARGGDGQDDLVLSGDSDVFITRDLNLNGGATAALNTNLLEITGSGVLLEVGDDLVANNARATLRWVADATGVSAIQIGTSPDDVPAGFPDPGVVTINGTILDIDLTAMTAMPTEIILIDSAFDAIVVGNFTDAALNPLLEGDNVPSAPGWAISYVLGPDFNDVGLIPGTSDPDADGDGMPESYENANGLSDSDPSDASSDNDGDGFEALFEYAMGTLAGDAASKPIYIIRRVGATMEIEYGPITNGVTYKVNASADGISFSEIDSFTAGADGVSNIVIDAAVFLDVELYQVEVVLPLP